MPEQDLNLFSWGIGQIWNPVHPEPQKTNRLFALCAAKLCSWKHQLCRRMLPEILKQRFESQKYEIRGLHRDSTRVTELLGRSKRQFDSRCLCWERPENWFKNWIFSFFAISQSRYASDWWGWGCWKYWRAHYFSNNYRKTNTRLRESWLQDCKRTPKNPKRKLQETSHHSRRHIAFPTDSTLESVYRMQVEKSEGSKYLLHVFPQETTVGGKWYDYGKLKLMVQRHLEQKIQGSHFKSEKSRRGQTCNWSSSIKGKWKERRIECQKQIREERRYQLDHDRPIHVEKHAFFQAWLEQERQREGTTSFTYSDRPTAPKLERWRWRTCWRYTESSWWKSVRDSKQTTLYKLQEMKLPKGEFM